MKKSLVALAALAVVGAASAQSTVSLTGNLDAGYISTETRPTGGPGTVENKGLAVTALKLRVGVVEDLGGGLKAAATFDLDSTGYGFGTALNRRAASVSLTGGFGQVRFDNVRSTNLLTKGMVGSVNLDQGIYDNSGIITRVPTDTLTYGLAFGDFTGYAQYVEAGADGWTTPNVEVVVLGGGYAKGPLAAGIQYKMHDFTPAYVAAVGGSVANDNRLEAFATYDFGMAKVGVGYDGPTVGVPAAATLGDAHAWSVGVSAPLGPVTIGANFAKRDVNKVTQLGVNYALSKRTAITAAFGRHTNNASRATDAVNTGLSGDQYLIAMTHSF